MTDSSVSQSGSKALDFLPTGIAAKPLYSFLGPLIDYAMAPSRGIDTPDVDPLVQPLLLDYQDPEAVNAYLNLFVRPVLGTRKSLDYAFQLLNIHPVIQEWWEMDPQERPYRFSLTFDETTVPRSYLDLDALISMIMALKNERSWLLSLRMTDCVGLLTLDNDCDTDTYYLDSLEGYVDPVTGIIICLHENFPQVVEVPTQVQVDIRTSDTVTAIYAWANYGLDFTILGEDTWFDAGGFSVTAARTSSDVVVVSYLPQFIDPVTLSFQAGHDQGRTWESAQALNSGVNPTVASIPSELFEQAVTVSVTPVIAQPTPSRMASFQVTSDNLYGQRTWLDIPDGRLATWSDFGLTWDTDQPPAYMRHSSVPVSVDTRLFRDVTLGIPNFKAGLSTPVLSTYRAPQMDVEPVNPGVLTPASNGVVTWITTVRTTGGYTSVQWQVVSAGGVPYTPMATLTGTDAGATLVANFTSPGDYVLIQTSDLRLSTTTGPAAFQLPTAVLPQDNGGTSVIQVGTSYSVSGTPGSPTSLMIVLPKPVSSGSNVLLMTIGGNGGSNNQAISPGVGWTQLVNSVQGSGWMAAWYAPSTVLSNGQALTITGIGDVLNIALIETTAQGFEAFYGPLSGAGTSSYGLTAQASGSTVLRYAMLASLNGGGLSSPTLGRQVQSFPGLVVGGQTGWAGMLLGFGAQDAGVAAVSDVANGDQPIGFLVNGYASVQVPQSTFVFPPGVTPTPGTLSAPVGGRPQYYLDYMVALQAGGALPIPRVGIYTGTGMPTAERANYFYWLQRGVDVLEFSEAGNFTEGSPLSVQTSSQTNFGKQLLMGATSLNLVCSIALNTTETTLYDVAAGAYDAVYAEIAQYLIAHGGAGAEIRLGAEMNESFHPWSANVDPTGFKAAFRRAVNVMRTQAGAQFLFSFCPLLNGFMGQNDPTDYFPGADAVDFIGGNYYQYAAMGTATTDVDQHLWLDGTASVSWLDQLSQQYGLPIVFDEFASGGSLADGTGVGDQPYYLTEFYNWQTSNNKPVFRLNWWESNAAGRNVILHPLDDGTPTGFPNTAQQWQTYFSGPVTAAGYPAKPGAPTSFTVTGTNPNGGLTFSYGAPTSGGTPQYLVLQFSPTGLNQWSSWNWVGLGSGVVAQPNIPIANGVTQVDVRLLFVNDGGISPWAQVTVDLGTGAPLAPAVIYSSALGNNDTTIAP